MPRFLLLACGFYLFICSALVAQGASSPSPSPLDQITIVGPANSAFDHDLKQAFPDVSTSPKFPALRDMFLLLHNGSDWKIKAVVIQWTVHYSNGSTRTFYRALHPTLGYSGFIPGDKILAEPGQEMLFSVFSGIVEGASSFDQWAIVTNTSHAFENMNLQSASSLSSSIDSILVDDDRVLGPDTYDMGDRFTCLRNSMIDEANALLPYDQTNATLQKHLHSLTHDFQAEASRTSETGSCAFQKLRMSEKLMALYQVHELEDFQNMLVSISRKPKITLVRGVGTPPITQQTASVPVIPPMAAQAARLNPPSSPPNAIPTSLKCPIKMEAIPIKSDHGPATPGAFQPSGGSGDFHGGYIYFLDSPRGIEAVHQISDVLHGPRKAGNHRPFAGNSQTRTNLELRNRPPVEPTNVGADITVSLPGESKPRNPLAQWAIVAAGYSTDKLEYVRWIEVTDIVFARGYEWHSDANSRCILVPEEPRDRSQLPRIGGTID